MRERSLDEFESIFQRASIPVLDIRELPLKRISTVVKGGALDDTVLRIAGYLQTRFAANVQVHWSAAIENQSILDSARDQGLAPAPQPFGSTAELVGQVSIARSSIVLIPEPEDEARRVVDVDRLVEGTAPPILLVRTPIEEPCEVFRRILHSLTGNFRQTQNFAHSFSLVPDDGSILLLHTIKGGELDDVRDALRVSSEISDASGDELLQHMTHHGERYLKGVVAASRNMPYHVGYRLATGDVVPTVRAELARGDYGLLVVGSHSEGFSRVDAEVYQLMHLVRDVPVLAL